MPNAIKMTFKKILRRGTRLYFELSEMSDLKIEFSMTNAYYILLLAFLFIFTKLIIILKLIYNLIKMLFRFCCLYTFK